jgi:hypothetical protein
MFDPTEFDDDDDDDVAPIADPPRMHEGLPIREWHYGEPIPDLDRIPKERWREVLRPLRHATRQMARAYTQSDVITAGQLVGELWLADAEATARAVDAPPPHMPAGEPPPPVRRRGHQVNFRLGPDEHARLAEAAELFAMAPTTLARVLTVRGVNRALYEKRRDA